MAWWLRALAALVEDLGSILSTHTETRLSVTPVPRGLMPPSGIHRHCRKEVHVNIRAGKTLRHIKNKQTNPLSGMVVHAFNSST